MIDLQMSLGCLRSPEREDKRERERRGRFAVEIFLFLSVPASSGGAGAVSFRFGRERRIKRVIWLSVFIYFKGIGIRCFSPSVKGAP